MVAPPLQTQLHHGCSVVVSQTVPNGNAVNCQSNMESQGGCGEWVCLESCEVCLGESGSYQGVLRDVKSVSSDIRNVSGYVNCKVKEANVVEAHCYALQCRRIDCEQLCSNIN